MKVNVYFTTQSLSGSLFSSSPWHYLLKAPLNRLYVSMRYEQLNQLMKNDVHQIVYVFSHLTR